MTVGHSGPKCSPIMYPYERYTVLTTHLLYRYVETSYCTALTTPEQFVLYESAFLLICKIVLSQIFVSELFIRVLTTAKDAKCWPLCSEALYSGSRVQSV